MVVVLVSVSPYVSATALQGSQPDKLFVLRKGLCKVTMLPDAEAFLLLRLKEIKFELVRITITDVYHRTLRPSARGMLNVSNDEAETLRSAAAMLRTTVQRGLDETGSDQAHLTLVQHNANSKMARLAAGWIAARLQYCALCAAGRSRALGERSFHPTMTSRTIKNRQSRSRRRKAIVLAISFVNRATRGAVERLLSARRGRRPVVNNQKKRWLLMRAKARTRLAPAQKLRLYASVTHRLLKQHASIQDKRTEHGGNESMLRSQSVATFRGMASEFIREKTKMQEWGPRSNRGDVPETRALSIAVSHCEDHVQTVWCECVLHPSFFTFTNVAVQPILEYIPRARAAERRRELLAEHARVSDSLRTLRSSRRPRSADVRTAPRRESASGASGDREVTIARLFPGCIFGEMALLDPWTGKNRGNIVAETHVELLSISKQQFDMSAATEAFLNKVRRKSTNYPSSDDVLKLRTLGRSWASYKKGIMKTVRKNRWPPSKEQLNLQHVAEDVHLLPGDLAMAHAL